MCGSEWLFGVALFGVALFGVALFGVALFGVAVWCGAVWCGCLVWLFGVAVWCGAVWCGCLEWRCLVWLFGVGVGLHMIVDAHLRARLRAGLDDALSLIQGSPWAAAEYFYMGGNSGSPLQQWETALNNTLGYKNCRFVDLFNWESMNADAVTAVATMLRQQPECLIDTVTDIVAVADNNHTVHVSWTRGPGAVTRSFMDVSSQSGVLPSGQLEHADVLHDADVTGISTYTFSTTLTTVWVSIVNQGCADAGFQQSAVADIVKVAVPP